MNKGRMLEQLELHEGFRPVPYLDTEENWTIAFGYNVTARGYEALESVIGRRVGAHPTVSLEEARRICLADIARVERATMVRFPEYLKLDEVRQRVVLDLAFNIGYHALDFKKCIAAIKTKNWSEAAKELYRSKWYTQVGGSVRDFTPAEIEKKRDRADRLVSMLLTGVDYVA